MGRFIRIAIRLLPWGHRPRGHRRVLAAFVGLALVAAGPVAAASARPSSPAARLDVTAAAPKVPPRVPSAAELARFFDAEVPRRLATYHVPGAVVSVVGAGKPLLSKGYGLADRERRTAFDPETSLVRIASITKLFTWTAVMQLVQQGKLDLHEDVNHYLTTFQIPNTFQKPITLMDLMNHTAGFEERVIGTGARRSADVVPLGTFLARHVPTRVRPRGEVSAYSNYGAALAGYIVSTVSGQPYDAYVRDHILTPLRMRHTTASEPVPARLAADLARSYEFEGDAYQRKPFVFDNLAPDGSISASANDMATFMLAHLQDGRIGDSRILARSTAALMHRRSFAADPRVDGYAHGFKEQTLNGHRVLMHDGNWEGFASALLLVPDSGLGLFVSANGGSAGIDALTEVIPAFFDRFVPGTRAGPTARVDSEPPAQAEVSGFYRPARSSVSTVEKLLVLTTSSRLRITGNGKLAFMGGTWTSLAPALYQRDDGSQRLAIVSRSGRTYAVTDGATLERVPPPDSLMVNLCVLLLFGITAVTGILGLPLAAAIRRIRNRPSPSSQRWGAGRILASVGGAVGLVFVVLLTGALVGGTSILYGAPTSIRLLLLLPLPFLGLALAATVVTATAWKGGQVGARARVHQVLLLVGLACLAWFCQHWNLIGWQFG